MPGAFLDCEAGPVGICPRDGTIKVGRSNKHIAMNTAKEAHTFFTARLIYKEIPSPHRGLGIFLSAICRNLLERSVTLLPGAIMDAGGARRVEHRKCSIKVGHLDGHSLHDTIHKQVENGFILY